MFMLTTSMSPSTSMPPLMPEVSPSMLAVSVFMLSWPFLCCPVSCLGSMGQVGRGGGGPTEQGFWPHLAKPDLFLCWPECDSDFLFVFMRLLRACGARARWDGGGEWARLSWMGRVLFLMLACLRTVLFLCNA